MDKELKRHYTLLVDFLGHILGPDYEDGAARADG